MARKRETIETYQQHGPSVTGDVKGAVVATKISAKILNVNNNLDDAYDAKIKEWLHEISKLQSPTLKTHSVFYDELDKYLRQIGHLSGCGQWFLDSALFKDWRDGATNRLWCYGIPGIGKSTLASLVIKQLQSLCTTDRSQSACVYIYFGQDRSKKRQTGTGLNISSESLIKSLLAQLVSQTSPVSDHIKQQYKNLMSGHVYTTETALDLFEKEAASFATVYIVVDGLEECPTDTRTREINQRKEFLHRILQVKRARCKLLVTSLQHLDIERTLVDATLFHITPEVVKDDLKRYIKKRVQDNIQDSSSEDDYWDEISEAVIKKCEGMFLHCKLIMNELISSNNIARADLEVALRKLPTVQEEIYKASMKRMEDHESDTRQRAMNILAWLNYAMRPLTMVELAEAISIETDGGWPHGRFPLTEENLRRMCADFAVSDGQVASISHYTAEEFLWRYLPEIREKPDLFIAEECLKYMSNPALQNELQAPGGDFRLPGFPLFGYAVSHWHEHLLIGRADGDTRVLVDKAIALLQNKALVPYIANSMKTLSYADGMTGLHIAASLGIPELVDGLVEKLSGSNASTQDGTGSQRMDVLNMETDAGETALHFAVRAYDPGVIETLLRLGVDVNAKNKLGRTAMHQAIEEQLGLPHKILDMTLGSNPRLASKRRLRSKPHLELDSTDNQGFTSLISAARYGMVDVVRALGDAGASRNAQTKDGWSALRWATNNNHVLVVEHLLRRHIDLGLDKWSVLHWAASHGNDYAVELIMHRPDVNVNLRTADGTALMCGVRQAHRRVVWYLTDHTNLDIRDEEGNTALHIAVLKDDSISWLLIESDADLNIPNGDGYTALHLAAKHGKASIAWLLLEKGARLDFRSRGEGTALHIAVAGDHPSVVFALLQHGGMGEINTLNPDNWAPFHIAAKEGAISAAQQLIAYGADINLRCQDSTDKTPLHIATEEGNDNFVRFLISNHVDIDARDGRGWTSLHTATNMGNTTLMEILLKAGADPNVRTNKWFTPLHDAAKRPDESVVKVLLDYEADPGLPDIEGQTSLHLALRQQDDGSEVTKLLIQRAGSDVLNQLENPPRVDDTNHRGDTPTPPEEERGQSGIHIAVMRLHEQSLKWLLKHGADIDKINDYRETALEIAIFNLKEGDAGTGTMVPILIAEGVDVNRQAEEDGWTALHLAASRGLRDVVTLMYKKAKGTPNRYIPNDEGKTPVDLAQEKGYDIHWP